MPDAIALSWRQYRLERRMFWRNPSAAFFNFLLPLLFLAGAGAALSDNQHQLNRLVPASAGMSVIVTTFTALAHALPNFESTPAYVTAVLLPVVAISFYVFDSSSAPGFVRTIADALPLKPLIAGLSAAMVSGKGLGSHLDELAVIALWGAFG